MSRSRRAAGSLLPTLDARSIGRVPGGGVAGPATSLNHTRRQQVIYVEHHNGPEQTDAGRNDWQPGWYAICDGCGWMAGPCLTKADAHAAADAHALEMGEVTLQELGRGKAGERLQVAWQASHGRRPDGWWLAVEVPGRPREEYGPLDSEAAMLAAKLTRMQQLEAPPTERPAAPGGAVHLRPTSHRGLPGQRVRADRLLRYP